MPAARIFPSGCAATEFIHERNAPPGRLNDLGFSSASPGPKPTSAAPGILGAGSTVSLATNPVTTLRLLLIAIA